MRIIYKILNKSLTLFPTTIQNKILSCIYFFSSKFYKGNEVYCPYCKNTFSRFLPHAVSSVYEGFHREFAKCPLCGSIERYRLLYHYLENKTDFFIKNSYVLEVGPSYQFQKMCLSLPNIKYTSIDLFSDLAEHKMDLMDLKFEDNSFDFIICYHVLEHVDDDIKAMNEIYRVLKHGGLAILQVPIADIPKTLEDRSLPFKEREVLYRGSDHLRLYGQDYKDRLGSIGFKVKVDDYVKHLDEEVVKRYGLDVDEDLYVCTK